MTNGTLTVGGKTVKVGAWTITPAAPPSVYDHPEHLAFLRAVLAEPAEDVHRLVLADWLEEHGERDRAEFIRVQVELEPLRRLTLVGDRMRHRVDLWNRQRKLLERHAYEWLSAPLMAMESNVARRACKYVRGFVSELRCRAEDWLAHADALCWRPEQTVECPTCKGRHYNECRTCHGGYSVGNIGRITRPVPPSAQPITTVNLTNFPRNEAGMFLSLDDLRRQWPGITFTLPPY